MNPRGIFSMHKMINLENNVKEKKNKKTEESKVGNQRMNKVLSIEVTIIRSVYHLFWQENKMT